MYKITSSLFTLQPLGVHFARLRRYEGLALKSISISCLLNVALGRIQYRHPQDRNSLCNILSVTLGWQTYYFDLEEESALADDCH